MKTGVYQIRNLVNGKLYIGSVAGLGGFEERWREHRKELRGNRHHNQHLQNSWDKHSEQCFVFEIVELCDPIRCIDREQHYLDVLQPEYNICQVAGNTLGYRHTHDTKALLSKIARERLSDPTANPMYGVRLTGASNGMYGKKHSITTRKKMRGESNGNVKLTERQVREIKLLKQQGISQYKRGEMFNVSRSTIKNIDLGHTWSWVTA